MVFTIEEVSKRLGVDVFRIYSLARLGRIETEGNRKNGGRLMTISGESLRKFLLNEPYYRGKYSLNGYSLDDLAEATTEPEPEVTEVTQPDEVVCKENEEFSEILALLLKERESIMEKIKKIDEVLNILGS